MPTATHVVDRNLELLAPLGIKPASVRFDLPERAEDGRWAEQAIGQVIGAARFALINPGAGWPSKLWPAERFAAVAAHLGRAAWPGEPGRLGGRSGARLGARNRRRLRRLGPSGSAEQFASAGGARPAVATGRQCRHRPVASGRGRRHPLRRPVRPHARRAERALRRAARLDPGGPPDRFEPRASAANNDTMLAIDVARVTAACDAILARRSDRSSA